MLNAHHANVFSYRASLELTEAATIIAQHTRIARIEAFVNARHKYHNFNGAVLVSENGRVVYQRYIGFAD